MRQKGFNLIELVVAMAIMGILMSVGIPSYRSWIESVRMRSKVESFSEGLKFAKSEAVRLNRTVIFQGTDSLTKECKASAEKMFWVVSLLDVTSNGDNCGAAPVVDPVGNPPTDANNPLILRKSESGAGSITFVRKTRIVDTSNADVATTSAGITFNSLGRVLEAVQGGIWIDFSDSSLGDEQRYLRITLSQSGQVKICDRDLKNTMKKDDPKRCTTST